MLHVAEETQQTRGKLFDQIKALHDVQMKSDLDLSFAQQGVEEADLLHMKAQAALDDGMTALAEALGTSGPADYTLVQPPGLPPPPAKTDDLVAAALAANPDLMAGQNDVETQKAQTTAQQRERLPVLTAYGYAGVTPYRDPDTRIEPEYATAGVNISMPFYTGGRLTAQGEADRLHAEATQRTLEDRRNQITSSVRTLSNDARTAWQNITLTGNLAQNAKQSVTLVEARYQVGDASIVDVVEAQLAETEAEIDATNAKFDYLLLRAEIDYTVGRPV